MYRNLRKKVLTASSLLVLTMATFLSTNPVMALGRPSCRQESIPVTLTAQARTVYHVAGWLCWQGSLMGKSVQFLEHGGSYDHNYWHWPQQQARYSYVQTATSAGYATFAIDRLGVGQSDHPDPNSVTLPDEAYVAHQTIQALRQGRFAHTAFSKVISVGHSAGSSIAVIEAGTYHDVDGVLATGFLHQLTTEAAAFVASFYPANQDPKFAGSGLSDGYLTTRPGSRKFFYNTAFASPSVIAKDEQLKQTITSGEVNPAVTPSPFDPAVSRAITVPVLLAMGQEDRVFCSSSDGLLCASSAAIASREQAAYSPGACLEASVLPRAGHNINLHPNAQHAYAHMIAWSYRRIGNGTIPPFQPCS
jgi:pimeloyl-ACP methyl ester carboxylesterase